MNDQTSTADTSTNTKVMGMDLKTHVATHSGLLVLFIALAISTTAMFASASVPLVTVSAPFTKNSAAAVVHGGISGRANDHILVKFKNSVAWEKRDEVLASHGLTMLREIKQIGVRVVKVPEGKTPEDLIYELKLSEGGNLEFAEVDALVAPTYLPNDPSYGSEWHHATNNSSGAWDIAKGAGVIIAILDTGTDCTHPDLIDNCVAGWNVVSNNNDTTDIYGHGTKTAGTAAEVGDNITGGVGVSYLSKIMPIRITNDSAQGIASWSAVASGITYAADHGARVVSNSYQSSDSLTVQSSASYLRSKGGLFVASAGNAGTLLTAANPSMVITVGATDSSNTKTSWSNYGAEIDVTAPGAGIFTTTLGGGYGAVSGTSFSAPATAGLLALEFSANPKLTPDQAESILESTAVDLGTSGWDEIYGWGRIDAAAAVAAAASTTGAIDTLAPSTPTNLSANAPDSAHVNLSWTASTDNVGVTGYKIFKNGSQLTTVTGTTYADTAVSPSTSYAYVVQATDAAGNLSSTSTTVNVTTPAVVLTVTSTSVPTKTGTTATISWVTNLPSTGVVKYGTTASTMTSSVSSDTLATAHSVSLIGLTKKTTYYYQVTATGADNTTTAISSVVAFTTKPR